MPDQLAQQVLQVHPALDQQRGTAPADAQVAGHAGDHGALASAVAGRAEGGRAAVVALALLGVSAFALELGPAQRGRGRVDGQWRDQVPGPGEFVAEVDERRFRAGDGEEMSVLHHDVGGSEEDRYGGWRGGGSN